MRTTILLAGGIIFLCGLGIEFLAVAAMAFYPIRKRLPFDSPLDLQDIGCNCITLGLVTTGLGTVIP